jgi:hypothetical protein
MHEQSTHHNPASMPSDSAARNRAAIELAEAMGRARSKQAEELASRADNRHASVSRLEAIRAQLAPLYAAIPRDVELFDLGMVAGDTPRLFVDIIAFIEMNRDMTAFRFMQETRSGRVLLAETGDEQALRAAVTDYIARRLLERERALAEQESAATPVARSVSTAADGQAHPAAQKTVQQAGGPGHSAIVASAVSEIRPHTLQQDLVETFAQKGAHTRSEPSSQTEPQQMLPQQPLPQTADKAFERWSNASAPSQAATPAVNHSAAVSAPEERTRMWTNPRRTEEGLAAIRQELSQMAPDVSKAVPEAGLADHASAVAGQAEAVIEKAAGTLQGTAQLVAGQNSALPVAAMAQDLGQSAKAAVTRAASTAQDTVSGLMASGSAAKAAAVATAASATVAATKTLSSRQSGSSGWWIWPLLALLIGIGLGALLLYLYAANILSP